MTRQHPKSPRSHASAPASAALLLALYASPAQAAPTRIVTASSARDFLSGEPLGTAVTADGRLTVGPALTARLWPDDASDAAVFGAASDSQGRVFVATGGGLGRLFVANADGKVSLLFHAAEPNITAVAVGPDGSVVCGTSPEGRLYRVDPGAKDPEKAGTVLSESVEDAIWALAFAKDGTLYVGTGNKGRVLRRGRNDAAPAKLARFAELEDTHVRTLAVGADGTVYAGTSDKGLVLAISSTGAVRTLHDFGRPEVVGLALLPDGTLLAAASTTELPPLGGARDSRPRLPVATPTPAPGTGPADDTPQGSVSVSTSTAPARPSPVGGSSGPARAGSGELVTIRPDGLVEPAWVFPEEAIFGIRLEPNGKDLLIATAGKGRVYSLAVKERALELVSQVEPKQIVALPAVKGRAAIAAMSPPGLFLPAPGPLETRKGSHLSAVRDASRPSRFGRLHSNGEIPAKSTADFLVRAGNSAKPDGTWTTWAAIQPDGTPRPPLPLARYFQWKIELSTNPKGESPELERVEFSYVEANARPIVENVNVLEPGAVFPRGGGSSTAVLSVTNPDESGIYSGLDSPREGGPEGPGRKLFRKGFRSVTWKGSDPNGDSLRYDIECRPEGSGVWFPIRKDLDEPYLGFDTTALPDGRYKFRVTASDRVSNAAGEALTDAAESEAALIDNTPPALSIKSRRIEHAELVVTVAATDALSPVTKAEAAVNADRWRLLLADDGATDSPAETFTFRVPKPGGPAIVSVRVVDAFGNVAAIATSFPKDFE